LKVDLSFDGIKNITDGNELFLIDKTTQTAYNLKYQDHLEFAVNGIRQKQFEILYGSQEYLESLEIADLLYPKKFSLNQNFPNPFNPVTQITFSLNKASTVKLEVYNVMGQLSDVLIDGYFESGIYNSVWDAASFSSGIYFFKLSSGNNIEIKRGILIK